MPLAEFSWEDGIRAGSVETCADAIARWVDDGETPFVRVPAKDGGQGIVTLMPDDATQSSKLFSTVAHMSPEAARRTVLVEIDDRRVTPSFGLSDAGEPGSLAYGERLAAVMGWVMGSTCLPREGARILALADRSVEVLMRVPGAALTDLPFLLINDVARDAMLDVAFGRGRRDDPIARHVMGAEPADIDALLWGLTAVIELPVLRHPLCLPHARTDLCRMAEDGMTVLVLLPPPAFDRGLARDLLLEVAARQLARLSLRDGARHGTIPRYAAEADTADRDDFAENMVSVLMASSAYVPLRDEVSREDRRRRGILLSDDRDAVMGLLSESE